MYICVYIVYICTHMYIWICIYSASFVAQTVKNLPVVHETRIWTLGQQDPLEKERVTHSSILAWRIPWTEETGVLSSVGSQRVGHDWTANTSYINTYICVYIYIYIYFLCLFTICTYICKWSKYEFPVFFTVFINSSNIYWSPTILDVLGKQWWKYRHNIQPDPTYSQICPAYISPIWMHWWTSISSYLVPIDHPQEKEMQKSIMAVWGGLTNSCEKKRSKRQRRKEKIYPFECRVPKNSKEK